MQTNSYTEAEKEVDEFVASIKKEKQVYAETTKQMFGKKFNTLKDLVLGDFFICGNSPVFIDAKRNGWVSENSINNFAGDYYMFYYPDENNAVEFVEAITVKKYYEKIGNKMIMPSGKVGYRFKKGTFKKALSTDDFLNKEIYG